ncbi:hypothetical protein BT63DRAFT_425188, partial [Microthyrium microscopicum]
MPCDDCDAARQAFCELAYHIIHKRKITKAILWGTILHESKQPCYLGNGNSEDEDWLLEWDWITDELTAHWAYYQKFKRQLIDWFEYEAAQVQTAQIERARRYGIPLGRLRTGIMDATELDDDPESENWLDWQRFEESDGPATQHPRSFILSPNRADNLPAGILGARFWGTVTMEPLDQHEVPTDVRTAIIVHASLALNHVLSLNTNVLEQEVMFGGEFDHWPNERLLFSLDPHEITYCVRCGELAERRRFHSHKKPVADKRCPVGHSICKECYLIVGQEQLDRWFHSMSNEPAPRNMYCDECLCPFVEDPCVAECEGEAGFPPKHSIDWGMFYGRVLETDQWELWTHTGDDPCAM